MVGAASVTGKRLVAVFAGVLAGAAGWALVDVLSVTIPDARVLLGMATAAGTFFATVLVVLGPLGPARAVAAGVGLAVPAAILMTSASFRFDEVRSFLETGHPLIALVIMVSLSIPYLVAGLGPERRWLDYPTLFDESWAALVRVLGAIVFTVIVLLVVVLSDALLALVGLTLIGDLLAIPVVPWLLIGGAFGLALAVAHEFSAFVSPRLPLRLLRLLTPVVLGVTALFLAVLPFRGLSGLFGDLSAAGVLMIMAFAATTLVTSCLDRDDDGAAKGLLRRSAALLALLLPVMAGFSLLAVAERVGQYGWTPDRLAAVSSAAILSAYGVAYLFAVARQRDWMGRIRRANALLALAVIGVAAAWLTPLLDPQRISATDQVARFESGRTGAAALDLWTIRNDWGRAGTAALAELAALDHPEAEVLAERLAVLDRAASRFDFETAAPPEDTSARLAALADALLVVPAGATLPPGTLDARQPGELDAWLSACRRRTPAGRPGCVAVVADLVPESPGDEVVLLTLLSDDYVSVTAIFAEDRGAPLASRKPHPISGELGDFSRVEALDRIASGDFSIVPRRFNVLEIDGSELVILP